MASVAINDDALDAETLKLILAGVTSVMPFAGAVMLTDGGNIGATDMVLVMLEPVLGELMAFTVATSVYEPLASTVAVVVRVAVAPTGSAPIVHTPVACV
jgi:hypothetical protein